MVNQLSVTRVMLLSAAVLGLLGPCRNAEPGILLFTAGLLGLARGYADANKKRLPNPNR